MTGAATAHRKCTMTYLLNPKLIAYFVILTSENYAFSHDAHGMTGSHWHATDVWGFVALGLALGIAVWLSRGDK